MENDVFITGTSCYFPNAPVFNEYMEDYLGLITGQHSRVKPIILKQNGIKQRYYALTKEQKITHTNAEMAVYSIVKLLEQSSIVDQDIELLSCATSSPDQMLPSHASMVHGLLKKKPLEIFSASGICLSCLQAFKVAYWGILSGEKKNAICSTSELTSATLLSKNYDIEYEKCADLGVQPYMALEKDFLRFMLSDGASAVLLQNSPGTGKALRIEWVEMVSYANELPTCMFMGAESNDDGELKGWMMVVLVVLAIGFYAMSLGPVTWVLLSEIFPNKARGAGMAVCTAALWIASFLLTYTFPFLNRGLDTGGTFLLYAVICLAGFLFIRREIPETKGKTLEQIEKDLIK